MKFAALALTLLLAVGSQAAAMQTDTPSVLDHQITMFRMGINSLQNSMAPLEGTEYGYVKEWLQRFLGRFDDMVATRKEEIVSFIQSAKEAASENIDINYDAIRGELTPMFEQLRIQQHIDQYIEKLGPILTVITADYRAATDTIMSKIEPQIEELGRIFQVNALDTKEKLIPIIRVFLRELTAQYNKYKAMAEQYVQETRDQMNQFIARYQSLSPEEITARNNEMYGVVNEIIEKFTKLQAIAFRQ